jgi:hypothetical protein
LEYNYPTKNNRYDYLVLGSKSNPIQICNCSPTLIWQGLAGRVKLYQIQ